MMDKLLLSHDHQLYYTWLLVTGFFIFRHSSLYNTIVLLITELSNFKPKQSNLDWLVANRHQLISAGILLIWPSGTNIINISGEIHIFSFKKMRLKMSSVEWLPFCRGNPIVEIRGSYSRLISTMGFPILVRWHLYIESGSWPPCVAYCTHVIDHVDWQKESTRLACIVTWLPGRLLMGQMTGLHRCNSMRVFVVMSAMHSLKLHDDVIKWKHFRITGPLWRESTGHWWFPSQRPVTRSFDVYFDPWIKKSVE